jgi:hypothetical protein
MLSLGWRRRMSKAETINRSRHAEKSNGWRTYQNEPLCSY